MNTVFTALLRLRTSLLAALLLAASVLLAQTLSAQENTCAFVKAADVAALLGGTIIAPPPGGPCVWKVADSKRKLLVLTYKKLPGLPVATMYMGFHDKSTREADEKIIDESGIADKAFSITPSFGVAFVMLKGERLLQLQFWTGARGTEKDRDALRVVARKATTAF